MNKKYVFFYPLILLLCINTQAQTITIGAGAQSGTSSNGASGDPGPMYKSSASSSFDYSRHHYVYTQSELAAAGLTSGTVITKLAWYKANSAASNGNFHFEIWMENSSLTSVQSPPQSWSNVTNGGTQVYSTNTQTMASSTGFIDYALSSPFTYTGGALEISVYFDCHMISGNAFTAGISWKKDYISNRTISYCGSTSSTTLNNLRTVRPQLRITYVACTAPSGGSASNITTNSATVSWGAVSGSQGYQYVVNQSSSNPSGSGTATSSTSLSLSSLTSNTSYYVHVRNKCGSTTFSGWITIPFTTLPSCYPTSSVSFANMTASTVTVNWSQVTPSLGYEYVVNQSSASPSGNGTPSSGNTVHLTGLSGGTTYYAHVRNVCSVTDKSPWVNTSFTTNTCNKPANVIFSNITDNSADILWSQMNNANGYQYAIDFSNQPPVSGITTTQGITVHAGNLLPNSKYYTHLRSNCFVADVSSWRLDSFITKMVCYAPVVQVNQLGTNNPIAFWDEVPSSIAYEYALKNNSLVPAFGNTVYTTSLTLHLPDDGQDYYLFVRSKCNSMFTFSPWTMVVLRTGTTNISSTTNTTDLEVYPNPTRDVLHVRTPDAFLYSITDITGRQLMQGSGAASQTAIDVASLRQGIYILHISTGTMEERIRFLKE